MNEKKVIKSASWYVVSNLFIRAISFITAPIFTHILTPTEYGLVSNFFAWEAILVIFISLCFDYSIGNARIDFKEKFVEYLSVISTFIIIVGCVFILFFLTFPSSISVFLGYSKKLIVFLFLYAIFQSIISLYQSKLRFEYNYVGNILIAIYSILFPLALSLLLIFFARNIEHFEGRILGMILPLIVLGIFCYLIITIRGKKIISLNYLKYALKFSLPLIPHGLAMIILEQIDRVMITKIVGVNYSGIYSFAYTFALIFTILQSSLMQAWQPWFFDNIESADDYRIDKSFNIITKIVFFAIIIYLCVLPEGIKLMGAKEFGDAKYVVIPLIMGCFFQFLYSNFVIMEMYKKDTYLIAIGSIIAAGANLLLNFLFIPKFGYIAAAYTTLFCYLILMVYHFSICKGKYKVKFFRIESFLYFLIFLPLISGIYFILYNKSFIFRYLICFIFIGIYILFCRNDIKAAINLIKKKSLDGIL